MSDQDKTLKETLMEAIGGNKETAVASTNETEQGISGEGASGETKTGETPEYVSGIDISDIPEQDRPRIKELLSKKAKLLEDGYQGKFKEVSEFKKAQDELVRSGLSVSEARDVLNKHLEQKRNPVTATEKKDALKTLDKLLEQAPYEQKAALEQMRTIISEETDLPDIKKKIENIEKALGVYQSSAMESRKKQVDTDLTVLSDKYGKDLIDKYRDVIAERGMQYPAIPISKILQIEIPMEEIEQAILTKGKKPLTQEKKNAMTSNPSGVTSAGEKVDIKKSSYADLLMKGFKK